MYYILFLLCFLFVCGVIVSGIIIFNIASVYEKYEKAFYFDQTTDKPDHKSVT